MKGCTFRGEKECKELSTEVDVRYFWGKLIACGHVTGISKQCMCIKTKYCFPIHSNIELFLPAKRNVIEILATVRSYKQVKFLNDIMCVEVVKPSWEYSAFIDSLGSSISIPD